MSDRDEMREELASRSIIDPDYYGIAGERLMVCVGCGCTDDNACLGGCFWAATDPESGRGICSNCIGVPIRLQLEQKRRIA